MTKLNMSTKMIKLSMTRKRRKEKYDKIPVPNIPGTTRADAPSGAAPSLGASRGRLPAVQQGLVAGELVQQWKSERINLKDLMTSYSDGGFFNNAYHDSETLEIDRRSSSKTPLHTNPYARVRVQMDITPLVRSAEGVAGGLAGGELEGEGKPPHGPHLNTLGVLHGSMTSYLPNPPDSQYDRSLSIRLPSTTSGNMTMRRRGISMRRMSMFPNGDPNHVAFTEDAIRNEMDIEEQNLVKELVALSTRDRIWAIRDLPMSFDEKKQIRSQVLAFKSAKKSRQFTCFADCSENMSLSFRRCGYGIRSARQTLELWQGIMKEIGGTFGTSVLSYFVFLKWLLMFNIFSFLVNFGFITIPQLVYSPWPNISPNVSFRGLEILTGAGYFNNTVMYYGGYSNETKVHLAEYNMQLAYFFTIAVYMVLCGIALIFSMASSFKTNYVLADPASNSAWQLLCSWDFNITNDKAVRQRKNNIRVQLKESMSEKAQRERLTLSESLKHFGVYLGAWLLSTSLARATDSANWSLLQEAETLLVPFVVSLMNLVVPLFYSLFNKFELYSSQRKQIYALCWESMVGQALYRLVIVDFLFLMLGSFFGEFLSNVIGTKLLPRLGVPEFDVARNVSLTQNCQPPRRSGRAAQMQTIFIALLFFPFFVGAVSMVAFTAWRVIIYIFWQVTRGRKLLIRVLRQQIVNEGKDKSFLLERLQNLQKSHPDKRSKQKNPKKHSKRRPDDHSSGGQSTSNAMVQALLARQQLEKEEEERLSTGGVPVPSDISSSSALIQAMQARQRAEGQERDEHYSAGYYESPTNTSSAVTQAMQARQRAQVEGTDDASDPTSSVSSVMMQVMQARQRAEEEDRPQWVPAPPQNRAPAGSSALIQAMLARQQAQNEYDDGY
ncbi:hypothetical protein F7725_016023 [Dissostichus mawsoni]|uniref:Transmembrane channel-like protein n=1 Tax=Dissostichus mawsoni TaxID=36200 RepID=A0A7J5Y3G2_DISMA|nr:hypothetical protein F7725_016023 [Dissostichus mawsoni]